MTHSLEGVCRFVTATAASTGAGATDVDLRPAAGCAWEIIYAWAVQDDGAVAMKWLWSDPDVTDQTVFGSTGTANSDWPFGQVSASLSYPQMTLAAALTLTYNRYLTFRFTASAASKNGYVSALVREYRGIHLEA